MFSDQFSMDDGRSSVSTTQSLACRTGAVNAADAGVVFQFLVFLCAALRLLDAHVSYQPQFEFADRHRRGRALGATGGLRPALARADKPPRDAVERITQTPGRFIVGEPTDQS